MFGGLAAQRDGVLIRIESQGGRVVVAQCMERADLIPVSIWLGVCAAAADAGAATPVSPGDAVCSGVHF